MNKELKDQKSVDNERMENMDKRKGKRERKIGLRRCFHLKSVLQTHTLASSTPS
jgi:hypothetical protein